LGAVLERAQELYLLLPAAAARPVLAVALGADRTSGGAASR
jgi:hypothetical protein